MNGWLYASAGILLFLLGLHGLFARHHLLRKLIGANIAASGVFLALLALPGGRGPADPVLQALVLTGIVISVSLTAFALSLLRRWHAETRRAQLDEKER